MREFPKFIIISFVIAAAITSYFGGVVESLLIYNLDSMTSPNSGLVGFGSGVSIQEYLFIFPTYYSFLLFPSIFVYGSIINFTVYKNFRERRYLRLLLLIILIVIFSAIISFQYKISNIVYFPLILVGLLALNWLIFLNITKLKVMKLVD